MATRTTVLLVSSHKMESDMVLLQRIRLPFVVFISLLCGACVNKVYLPEGSVEQDGRYDSTFPNVEVSDELEHLLRSVKFINCVATYRRMVFPAGKEMRRSDITPDFLDEEDVSTEFFTDTASGTATVIYHGNGKIAILTSFHVVNFPDTLFSFVDSNKRGFQDRLRSIAVKERQSNYIPDIQGADRFEILAFDAALDMVVLGQSLAEAQENEISVFDRPVGEAGSLDWGSFVYAVGYPGGIKMITRGLVSKPFRDAEARFVIDASFNRGFSGGPVLAIKDGVPNIEWVGLSMTSAGTSDVILIPSNRELDEAYDYGVPYDGDVFIHPRRNIRYGITMCVSMERIRDFIRSNMSTFLDEGYLISLFD